MSMNQPPQQQNQGNGLFSLGLGSLLNNSTGNLNDLLNLGVIGLINGQNPLLHLNQRQHQNGWAPQQTHQYQRPMAPQVQGATGTTPPVVPQPYPAKQPGGL